MVAPIVANAANLDGQVVTFTCDVTSLGATTATSGDLPTYAPNIDLRIGHPVISVMFIATEAGCSFNSNEIFLPENEMARATAPDSTGEFSITDQNTIAIYLTPNFNGLLVVTYIAMGGTKA